MRVRVGEGSRLEAVQLKQADIHSDDNIHKADSNIHEAPTSLIWLEYVKISKASHTHLRTLDLLCQCAV